MTDFSTNDVHSRTLTAFFDTRGAADQAVSDLEAAGVPRQHISRVDGGTAAGTGTATGSTGFWDSLKEMFMPEEDRYGYAEALQRGGFLVSVKADEANYTRVSDILDRDGAIDMDEREASWRKEGWAGYQASSTAASTAGSGSTGIVTDALGGSAGTNTRPTGTVATGAERGLGAGQEDVIQVYEEQLNVGKRDVSHGRVRLRSYVVETAVSENVTLRDETVTIDRHAVDRPVAALGADAFKERTIELEEVDEEAVVGKTARVVEEIGIRKDVTDRVETVSDTVRSTKVDIEDGRTVGTATSSSNFSARLVKDIEVVGSDGVHVGIIDHVDGGMMKLKRMDPASGGQHHLLPAELVKSVDGKAMLSIAAADAMRRWTAA